MGYAHSNGDFTVVARFAYTVWGHTKDCDSVETCYMSTTLDDKETVLYDCNYRYHRKGEDFTATDCTLSDVHYTIIDMYTGDTTRADLDFKDQMDMINKWEADNQ